MSRRKGIGCFPLLLAIAIGMTGCGGKNEPANKKTSSLSNRADSQEEHDERIVITPLSEITEMESGFSTVRYDGDYGFDGFLGGGGASSDKEVIRYLAENLISGFGSGDILGSVFGCSTIAVANAAGDRLFGRNFDWKSCEAIVVAAYPENGYASVSTVNMDFITQNTGGMVGRALSMDKVKTLAALYAPLDGMNEAGLGVSVNMIEDSASIEQNTDKPDITTTTAVRLLLDKAADVEEALKLLEQYDLHASMGMMVHFALADSTGRNVAVEYVNNQMTVTETPVLTNFYLAEGDKKGVGTQQSHERYDILMERLERLKAMEMPEVREALDSVSKDNFEEFASTEWSAVFNLSKGEAVYYHRENYDKSYLFVLEK